MTAYFRNTLTWVWALLAALTVASWWIGRGGAEPQLNMAVTVTVLVAAALKAQLVIQYFMEVRTAPTWLKWTTYGWVVAILVLLLLVYWLTL